MNASTEAKLVVRQLMSLKSVEDLRLVHAAATSFLEWHEKVGTVDPEESYHNDEALKIEAARHALIDESHNLTGPESALLACFLLSHASELEAMTSRQISSRLGDRRSVPNITTVMRSLSDKSYVVVLNSDDNFKHKRYSLTKAGERAAESIIDEVRSTRSSANDWRF